MIDVEKFKAARKASGLSQTALAKMVGVSQQLIGEIERGATRSTTSIYKIAGALRIRAYDLDNEIPRPTDEWETTVGDLRNLPADDQDYALSNLKSYIELVKKRTKRFDPL